MSILYLASLCIKPPSFRGLNTVTLFTHYCFLMLAIAFRIRFRPFCDVVLFNHIVMFNNVIFGSPLLHCTQVFRRLYLLFMDVAKIF